MKNGFILSKTGVAATVYIFFDPSAAQFISALANDGDFQQNQQGDLYAVLPAAGLMGYTLPTNETNSWVSLHLQRKSLPAMAERVY